MTKQAIKSLGDFRFCWDQRLPVVDLTRVSATFSYVSWDLITVYWLRPPEPQQLIKAMYERGCGETEIGIAIGQLAPGHAQKVEWINTESLAVKLSAFYEAYRAKTNDTKNKLSGVLHDKSAFSGGFTCRRENGDDCYDFVLNAVKQYVAEHPPTNGVWLGDTSQGPIIG